MENNVPTGDFPLLIRRRGFSVVRGVSKPALLCTAALHSVDAQYSILVMVASASRGGNSINIDSFPPAAPYSKRFPHDLHCLTNLHSNPNQPVPKRRLAAWRVTLLPAFGFPPHNNAVVLAQPNPSLFLPALWNASNSKHPEPMRSGFHVFLPGFSSLESTAVWNSRISTHPEIASDHLLSSPLNSGFALLFQGKNLNCRVLDLRSRWEVAGDQAGVPSHGTSILLSRPS
jgi:hypothetical protein